MNWYKLAALPADWQGDWQQHMTQVFQLSFNDNMKLVKFRKATPNFVAAEIQYNGKVYVSHAALRDPYICVVVISNGRSLVSNCTAKTPYDAMSQIRNAILSDGDNDDNNEGAFDPSPVNSRTPDLVGV